MMHRLSRLGFYGLVGAGRSEFMQALFGITRPAGGRVVIEGRPVEIRAPADAVANGIVYVPEDRGTQAAITALPMPATCQRRASTLKMKSPSIGPQG